MKKILRELSINSGPITEEVIVKCVRMLFARANEAGLEGIKVSGLELISVDKNSKGMDLELNLPLYVIQWKEEAIDEKEV